MDGPRPDDRANGAHQPLDLDARTEPLPPLLPNPDLIHGFTLIGKSVVPERQSSVRVFRHLASGAEVMSVENDDNNKVFIAGFETHPDDSSGANHVLEHCVLNGSRKYPLNDVFNSLARGAISTFMNAFTYPDMTIFTLGSINQADLLNQIEVYMDLALNPRLTLSTFLEQGWRLDFKEDETPYITGVVYNEVRDEKFAPAALIQLARLATLFPGTSYEFNYGGEIEALPDLALEKLRDYHRSHYAPSRCRVLLWGNHHLEETLELLDRTFQETPATEVDPVSCVAAETQFNGPVRVELPYGALPDEHAHFISRNWVLGEPDTQLKRLQFLLLDEVLLKGPSSLLKKALIESGLGEGEFSSLIDIEPREWVFSAGLQGVPEADIEKVVELVEQTLARLAHEGIPLEDVEAGLKQLEFGLFENNSAEGLPQGMPLLIECIKNWFYGQDPLSPLFYADALEELKRALREDRRYLEKLIEKYLIENNHKATIVFKPDAEMEERHARLNACTAQEKLALHTPESLAQYRQELQELVTNSGGPDSPETLACIPRVNPRDLPANVQRWNSEVLELGGVKILLQSEPCNGLTGVSMGFSLAQVPAHLLPYSTVLGRALCEAGTVSRDYADIDRKIRLSTGGLEDELYASPRLDSCDPSAWLFLGGKSFRADGPQMVALMGEIIEGVNLRDPKRLSQIVSQMRSDHEQDFLDWGSDMVRFRLQSPFHPAFLMTEQMNGTSQLLALRQLEARIENDWEGVQADFQAMHQALLNKGAFVCNITAEPGQHDDLVQQVEAWCRRLPQGPACTWSAITTLQPEDEVLVYPTSDNFSGQSYPLSRGEAFPAGVGMVLAQYLETTYLYDKIQRIGGAYGVYAYFNRGTGLLTVASYRDPEIERTLDVYEQMGTHLLQHEIDPRVLKEAKLGTINTLLPHYVPLDRGDTAFDSWLRGESDDMRQSLYQQVLAVSEDDLRMAGERLVSVQNGGARIVLTSAKGARRATRYLGPDARIVRVR